MSIGRENMKIVLSQDGTRIYADALGDPSNPPIVFIHGFSFSGTVFDKLFSHTQLLGRYYLVRLDQLRL
jgi:pimeloyl-ACP methyl ester carboxylesterase